MIRSPIAKALAILILGIIGTLVQWVNTGVFNASEVQTLLSTFFGTFVVWLVPNRPQASQL